jgi:CheY-like chemotaxis protein/HPt (histidine-containing phosphotransfer) domain-containing protein
VAEDNPVNQRLAESLLTRRGHRVVIVGNGRLAVDAVAASRFDVVLMDAQMPVLGGLEATKLIRDEERRTGRHLPIVAMTARAMAGDRERCLAAGMDDYIAKPIRVDELARVLRSVASEGMRGRAESAGAVPPDGPPVDVESLLTLLEGDRELVGELFTLFVADAPLRLEELRAALSSSDVLALGDSAHALKGAAGNLYATEVERAAAEVERCAHQGDLARAAAAVAAVAARLERALEMMGRWSPEPR